MNVCEIDIKKGGKLTAKTGGRGRKIGQLGERLLTDVRKEAVKILGRYRSELDLLAATLLRDETLSGPGGKFVSSFRRWTYPKTKTRTIKEKKPGGKRGNMLIKTLLESPLLDSRERLGLSTITTSWLESWIVISICCCRVLNCVQYTMGSKPIGVVQPIEFGMEVR